jgi:UDP-N-acetylmuramate dehydrogenase
MIEAVGLKGFRFGDAQVSEMHANFIVNNGSALASDVVAIIMEIRRRVKLSYGIELQPEIRFIGF